jgi:hypothetical protein
MELRRIDANFGCVAFQKSKTEDEKQINQQKK